MSDVPELRALKRLRVAELRALLESRDVDSSGTKDELVNRLDACRAPVAPEDEDAPAPKKTKPAAPDAPSLASPSPPPRTRAQTRPLRSRITPPGSTWASSGTTATATSSPDSSRRTSPPRASTSRLAPRRRQRPPRFCVRGPAPGRVPGRRRVRPRFALGDPSIAPGAPARCRLPREPPPTVPIPRRFIFTRRPRDLLSSVRVDSNLGRRLIVDGLPPDVTEETATRVFRAHGSVRSVRPSTRARGKTTYRDAPRWNSRRETRQRRRRARSRTPPRSSDRSLRVSRNGESGAGAEAPD